MARPAAGADSAPMKIQALPKDIDRLAPTAILQQTAFWARVQSRLGHDVHAFDLRAVAPARGDAPPHADDFLVVTRRLEDGTDMAYVPFGPERAPPEGASGLWLEQLSEAIAATVGPRCAFVRWDLPWELSRDAPATAWARELHMNFGSARRALRKAPTDYLPVSTLIVDLHGSEEELLARMHPRTRYRIRLAERHGVEVAEGTLADLPEWYALHCETARRHGLPVAERERFAAVLRERADGTASPAHARLLLARRRGVLVAGMVLVGAGPRATYLYGASAREHRAAMGSYALQWAAMRLARAEGYRDYDMFGVSPGDDPTHPLHGLYRFKVGFGGRLVHREGCWDFPLDARYETLRAIG